MDAQSCCIYWVSPRCAHVPVPVPFVSGPFVFFFFLSSKQFIREQRSSFPSEENCGNIEKALNLLLKGKHIEKQKSRLLRYSLSPWLFWRMPPAMPFKENPRQFKCQSLKFQHASLLLEAFAPGKVSKLPFLYLKRM